MSGIRACFVDLLHSYPCVTAHIGCCVQKTNGSVSTGPGKPLDTRHFDTHEHCTSYTRHTVVHESVISLAVTCPPPCCHFTCCDHFSLSLSFAVSWTNSQIFFPVSDVLFSNHSTQIFAKMSDHLWVESLQLSCPEEQGSHCRVLPVCVLVCAVTSALSAHSSEAGTQVTWLNRETQVILVFKVFKNKSNNRI